MIELTKPFVLWMNYGYEGWHPKEFDSLDQLLEVIRDHHHGEEFVVTKLLDLSVQEKIPSEREGGERND